MNNIMETSEIRKLEEIIKVKELPITADGKFRYFYVNTTHDFTIISSKFSKYINHSWCNVKELIDYDVKSSNNALSFINGKYIARKEGQNSLILLSKEISGDIMVFSNFRGDIISHVDKYKFSIDNENTNFNSITTLSFQATKGNEKLKIIVSGNNIGDFTYKSYFENLIIENNTFKDKELMKVIKLSAYLHMYYLYNPKANNSRGIKLK